MSSIYTVRLTERMLIAIVDRAADHADENSPRFDHRTTAALERRGIISADKLTAKGFAYLNMALYEYARTSQSTKRQRTQIIRAVKSLGQVEISVQ